MVDHSKNRPREKVCGCGAKYVGFNRSVRCPACRALFNRVYIHAYQHGVYLNEQNWREYGRAHGFPVTTGGES